MTSKHLPGLHRPQHWNAPTALASRSLTLEETLVIRHRLAGLTNPAIAEVMRKDVRWVTNRLTTARRRWGAASVPALLEMPELLDAVREKK
jgi:hypothetical protein